MADIVGEKVESPPGGNDDAASPSPSTRGDGSEQATPPHHMPSDCAWAVAFNLNVAITFISAVYNARLVLLSTVQIYLQSTERQPSDRLTAVFGACVLVVPTLYATSWTLLHAMVRWPALMLQISDVVLSLASLAVGRMWGGRVMVMSTWNIGLVGGSVVLSAWSRWGITKFSRSSFKAAALAVKSTPHIMWWGLSMMAIQVVWLVVGLTATIVPLAYGVPFRGSDGATSQTSFPASIWYILLACFWILSVAWQFIVVEKVVAATVASSAASWCSSPGDVEPVWVTFRRVLNSSLGSICRSTVPTSTIGVLLTIFKLVSIMCGLARSCPVLFLKLTASRFIRFAAFMVSMNRSGILRGAATAFVAIVIRGLLTFSHSPASFNVPEMVLALAVVPAFAVTFGAVKYANDKINVCFKQDPEAFAEDRRGKGHDDLYRAWRATQPVDPKVEEKED